MTETMHPVDLMELMKDVVDPELGINVVDPGWFTACTLTTRTMPPLI